MDSEQNLWPSFVDVMSNMLVMLLFVAIAVLSLETGGDGPGKGGDDAPREEMRLGVKLEGALAAARKERIKADSANLRLAELNALVFQMEGAVIRKDNEIKSLRAAEASLTGELARLNAVFDMTDKYIKWQQVQIVELGKALNRALANKTAELVKVRSAFFEGLLRSLENNENFVIKGDRFALPSEVFFASESAEISPAGRAELEKIAGNLNKVMHGFPKEAEWVLRVDGHTDSRPIRKGSRYADNWELSSARAISVVSFLIEKGIPPDRLAAAGFGEFQPVSDKDAENRRIEFKLTER